MQFSQQSTDSVYAIVSNDGMHKLKLRSNNILNYDRIPTATTQLFTLHSSSKHMIPLRLFQLKLNLSRQKLG